MNVFFPNSCIFLCRGKNCISVQCYSDPEFSKVDMGPWDKTRNITANMYLSFCYIMFLTFSLEDEHDSKIVIEGCWIRSIAFCSRSARFWDFHLKMNLFLGLALEDGGEATLQQGYHWIDQHVSEIVCRRCFWDCLCGIWTCFWGLGSTQHVSEIFIGRWGVERQVLETPSELRANMNRWMQSHSRRVELSPFQKLSVKRKNQDGFGLRIFSL